MATDYLFQQSEVYAKQMPEFFGRFNVASNLIKKGEAERIGERDYRAPFLTEEGGKFRTYSPDGGSPGVGSASKGGYFVGTYFSLALNFQLTELAIKATESKEVAQFNAFKRAMKAGFPEFANYVDKLWHGTGSAVLGTATAVTTWAGGAKTVYTMDTTNGVQWLRRGQPVIPYVNALSSAYDSSAEKIISSIDYDARKVYLNGLVTSPLADDKLCLAGVSGASPTSVKGLQYFNSYATSGTILGVDRAVEPEVIANSVNCGGLPTFMKVLQLSHKILKRRGEVPKGLIGLCSPEQQANIRQQVQDIANYDLAKGGITADLGAGPDMKFKFGGNQMYLDIHQDTTRIDFIIPSTWKVLRLGEVSFFEVGGQRFWPLYDTTTGVPKSTLWFSLVQHEDFVCNNPGVQGVLYGCSQPTY